MISSLKRTLRYIIFSSENMEKKTTEIFKRCWAFTELALEQFAMGFDRNV